MAYRVYGIIKINNTTKEPYSNLTSDINILLESIDQMAKELQVPTLFTPTALLLEEMALSPSCESSVVIRNGRDEYIIKEYSII